MKYLKYSILEFQNENENEKEKGKEKSQWGLTSMDLMWLLSL